MTTEEVGGMEVPVRRTVAMVAPVVVVPEVPEVLEVLEAVVSFIMLPFVDRIRLIR